MLKTQSFPSVFETNTTELVDVADGLLEGLKVQVDDEQYVVGDLALREGTAPHKGINNAPSDLDYRLLLRAGLLVAQAGGADTPLTLTTGFPYSSYRVHRRSAGNLIEGEQEIEFDGRPFGEGEHSVVGVDIADVEVLPEIEGHVTATREGEIEEDDPFFAVSLGYGTFESVLSLPSGPVQRTATSGHGLRYATSMMAERLREKHYLDMPTEHQIDMAMRPFGVGPRQRWTSVITDREEGDDVAWFRDVMRDGPFPRWRHTHRFRAHGDETVIEDRLVYRLPLGELGKAAGPLGVVGFEPMFRYRHRRTKELLE